MTFTCELFYSDGGHSGPFHSPADARAHALRYLASMPSGRVNARRSTTSDRTDIIGEVSKVAAGPQKTIMGGEHFNPTPIFAAWGCLRDGWGADPFE